MYIGVGIDTGGTYTDGVVYDFTSKTILASAKALTTKEDLTIGISECLDHLPQELLCQAAMISLSTTLATNACVENKGGRAKLLCMGVYPKVVADSGAAYGLPPVDNIYFYDSQTTFGGEICEQPDWEQFLTESRSFLADAQSAGVVEVYAMNNGAVLEREAKQLVENEYHIPVVYGSELFSGLNVLQRAAGTLLNARLLPIIENFLDAVKTVLKQRGVTAPIVIVRSDSTLMSEEFTADHPVETLLCGPAASVMGGAALTDEKDSLIIDMGGTTTDIAMVKDGVPVRSDGVTVGSWRTFVKGLQIDTFGLGGDSAVRFNRAGELTIEAARIVPISVLAAAHPSIVNKLKALCAAKHPNTRLVHEFFSLVRSIDGNSAYSQKEQDFCAALQDGPLSFAEAADAIGSDVYNLDVTRLEEEGIVIRAGLTPTDIMHIKGDFTLYDAQAARYAAEFVSMCVGLWNMNALCDIVYDRVKKTLYQNLIHLMLCDKYPYYREHGIDAGLDELICQSWEAEKSPNAYFNANFCTNATLIGIGAPIHIFLPDVAKALHTRCIIPPHAEVANALGALAGHICADFTVNIKPAYSPEGITEYAVHGREQVLFAEEKEDALVLAKQEAQSAVREEAIKRGAIGELTVTTEVLDNTAVSRDNITIFLGTKVIGHAIGAIGDF